MKFQILQERLAPMLASATRFTNPKSTIPVLSNVLLTAKDGQLYVSATDTLMAITLNASAKIEAQGSITLPGKLLTDFVAELPDGVVSIDVKYADMSATVESGAFKTTIKGIDADEFPTLPTIGDNAIVAIDGSAIKSAVNHVAFAASTSTAHPVLNSVYLKLVDTVALFAAADGIRLATYESELVEAVTGVHELVIPTRAMQELARLVSDEEVVEIVVTESNGQVLFHTESVSLVARLLEGTYPNIQAAVPETFNTRIIADSDPFRRMIKMATPFAEASTRIFIDLNPADEVADTGGNLVIRAASGEIGAYNGSLTGEVHGPKSSVLLNATFLAQAMPAVKAPKIAIEMRESSKPVVIKEVGVPEWTYVVFTLGAK